MRAVASCEGSDNVCSMKSLKKTLYPKDVASSVQQAIADAKSILASSSSNSGTSSNMEKDIIKVPDYMQPDDALVSSNLRDATMIELEFDKKSDSSTTSSFVKEVDVLLSREMIQQHTGKYGSLCFVVRRPG